LLFHSYVFLYFFFATLILHELLPQPAKRYLLLVSSLIFYGAWNAKYLLLLLLTTLIDYYAAKLIANASTDRRRKIYLFVSMASNIGILGTFKYYNFFADSFDQMFGWNLPLHHLLLPVGISFYTFQSMSYTIDVYRRDIAPAKDFVEFLLFVSFFPQLVAGPIVRASEFLPQMALKHRPRPADSIRRGVLLFALGFFRKVVIADNLSLFVDAVHRDPAAYTSADLWIGALAFVFQVYYDFAGYSDMAIGLALFFGFHFPENFRRPFMGKNLAEVWQRWHISLSTWLRDYLYIPLGGNRFGRLLTYRNIFLTMAIGGLWHGAGWTFLLWGSSHGVAMVIHRIFRGFVEKRPGLDRLTRTGAFTVFSMALTFVFWNLSLVVFRSGNMEIATEMLRRMFVWESGALKGGATLLLCAALYLAMAINEKVDLMPVFERLPLLLRGLGIALLVWIAMLFAPHDATPFFYFQF
jgi:alginate O-acetyltransferase complex protein AlgI